MEHWAECRATTADPALSGFMDDVANDAAGQALLAAIFGNSPWLTRCILAEPVFLRTILEDGLEHAFDASLATLEDPEDDIMRRLRIARRRMALTVAIADISGAWDLPAVTGALSRFADQAVTAALRSLLLRAAANGEIAPTDAEKPEREAGLFILGLGKLGARELNYSSDIDLIAFYDPRRLDYTGRQDPQRFYVRVVRDLVNLLESRTRDGYAFRTDLRLRPDPGSTPVAVSVRAAETYYESTGQNWERAALIKARVVAGDEHAGNHFLEHLEPFLWRKSLDFAAIEDIHSIKRQINAHRGGGAIAVAGHNLKLGRGGIREIEFFAQTQQLIWGGRVPALRTPGTVATIRALEAEERVSTEAARDLTAAYDYLRRAEHRLQMIDDRQTHSLPEDPEEIDRFAVFFGYDGAESFARDLTAHLGNVEHHYAHLFEEAAPLSGPGNLVFTGSEDDPDTLTTLAEMGFSEGSALSERIRSWHRGRYRATRSARARELLTELVPGLLDALAKTPNPDAAFRSFDAFLSNIPAGVQLFSLLLANPGVLSLVAEIMGSGPKLAAHLAANPSLFDGVLTGDFYGELESREELAEALAATLEIARDFEDVLDRARRFANDQKFRIGMQIIKCMLDADRSGAALTDLAEVEIAALYSRVAADFEARHGRVPGQDLAVVALGKLGGREITENSDLDLLFVYDEPPEGTGGGASDGPRPLAPSQYFARFSQQLITALSAPTAEGLLYEVDMRLRPSGNAGPIASSVAAFLQYQEAQAWTWEHMALTRARVIAGPDAFAGKLGDAIRAILTAERDADALRRDVVEMRRRIADAHPPQSPWDVKYLVGGLVDVEFIAQYLQLRHAHDHPEVLDTNTNAALDRLAAAGLLEAETAATLCHGGKLWRTIQGMLRFTVEGPFDETAATEGLKMALVRAAEMEDFAALRQEMAQTAAKVRDAFIAVIGDPDQVSPGETTDGN
ncbi:MAG: bifunctional [glutamine synthetase] adenylyltransferase/[glutamine synthetase]-adenylyl-L-tyrosine phosphorylase [Alphaproteobacteria bacterium]|nr:bifunctional [glutamine synthetase] adenylyltransferase/[glutamine synthetase]-adenylyl-L-tyrosine phosphorylase [Alphaproteobacteria bacterium]